MITASSLTRLQARLDRLTRRRARASDPMPAPQVLLTGPDVRFEHGDLGRRFHCASIDKVMTAVAVARLVERGVLAFDAPLGQLLPAADLAGLPAARGVDLATDATVDHLLTHTAGLPDWFDPPRGQEVEASMSRVVLEPDRTWTRGELLDQVRGMEPIGRPGQRFVYSDTAYLLLGRVLEEVTGLGYVEVLGREVFDPAGMRSSSVPFDDDFSVGRLEELGLAPMWLGRQEVSRRGCLSVGWGSVVTTPDDLVRLSEALHGGELVGAAALAHLARPRHRLRPGIHYGAGLVTLRFEGFMPVLLRGLPRPVGGLGLSATHLFHYPQQGAHVVLNFHSTRAMSSSFQTQIAIARMLAR